MTDIWYTLAVSDLGTHKMRFREEMTYDEAVMIGVEYCEESNLQYVGTYSVYVIDYEETSLRKYM